MHFVVFCIIITVNSDYLFPFNPWNCEMLCSLRGTDWIIKYCLEELRLHRLIHISKQNPTTKVNLCWVTETIWSQTRTFFVPLSNVVPKKITRISSFWISSLRVRVVHRSLPFHIWDVPIRLASIDFRRILCNSAYLI